MYFVNQDKAFDRVQRKVLEWAMRKKGIPGFGYMSDESV